MNFFEAQDNARRKTGQLTALFIAAVVALVILTNILVAVALGFTGGQRGATFSQSLAMMDPMNWVLISGGIVGLVAVASLYKFLSIRGGGRTIAEAMGGQLLSPMTANAEQQQLLNIVEEMAIASGVPVPPVYLIPEASINAFAAGFGQDDAVIGINQGTLDLLDRAELSGVVAHEFSHILNGDTNINLRLIAILHGILFIGMIGYGLLRIGGVSRRNGMPFLALGLGMLVIGYGGTFFGNLIKSAVSRQREYLADASAVQFTRDPNGIADALKKIGGYSHGSQMEHEKASEASHMFFGAISHKLSGMFATHPPLDERIRAIQPNWNGAFLRSVGTADAAMQPGAEAMAGFADRGANPAASGASPSMMASVIGSDLLDHVGRPDQHSLHAAQQLIAEQPDVLAAAAHDPFDARALVYAMLLHPQTSISDTQYALLEQHADPGIVPRMPTLRASLDSTDAEHQMTLLEMAMPALKQLSKPQYQRFSQNAAKLITIDRQIDVFEWMLHRVLVKELQPHFEGPQRTHGRIKKISRVADEATTLLSILACVGHDSFEAQLDAFQAGMSTLDLDRPFNKQEYFDFERTNDALANLRKLRPLVKPALLKACAATVNHDLTITANERALMHGIAATLDCPLPPGF